MNTLFTVFYYHSTPHVDPVVSLLNKEEYLGYQKAVGERYLFFRSTTVILINLADNINHRHSIENDGHQSAFYSAAHWTPKKLKEAPQITEVVVNTTES